MTLAPSVSRQQRRTEQTRQRLLDAALQAFLEHGYDGVTTGDVTKRADLGAGTYYLHFRDKRAAYEALVRRELTALQKHWRDERAKRKMNGEAWAEISLMVEMVLESLLADRDFAQLVLLDGPPLETWLVEEIGRDMARVLGDGGSTPELLANLVIGATLNAGRWSLARPRSISTKRLIADAVAFCAAGVTAANLPKAKRRS